MAEVIDENHVLPHRLYAMTKTVDLHPRIARIELLRLLQPEFLNESSKISVTIFRKSQLCGLIAVAENKSRTATLNVDDRIATDFEAFREYMQGALLGVTEDDQDHAVLNLFAAWFAVQGEWVLTASKSDWEIRFNSELFPNRRERVLNEHPGITAWLEWADFLGWGWQLKFGTQEASFAPDCTLRLRPLLATLLPDGTFVPFSVFMGRLRDACPELDGGALFERCWQASRPNERRGNRLSLMLSTAIRVLYQSGELVLENRADATENWTLFPAQSHIARVTHIRKGAAL